MTIVRFQIVHNDGFPDGTYAEVEFDHIPTAPAVGGGVVADASADTSGGVEPLNGGSIGYDHNSGGHSVFNCTTVDQVDTFTNGGSITFNACIGFTWAPGGTLTLPQTLTITSAI